MKGFFRALNHYFVFFLLVAFVITCCTMLFVSVLTDTLGVELTEETVGAAAKLTFANVVALSLIFTGIDTLRRKLTVQRPLKQILQAAERIVQGDFSVRVPQQKKFGADDTFQQLGACFNKMAQELGSVETLRTDFIANVSHELKTPLTVIRNYGTLLQSPTLSQQERLQYAKGVTDSAQRMASMVTNILKLNRLENQQIYPNTTRFDLAEQLRECILQFESVWEEKDIEIEAQLAEDIAVKADRELLEHVWNNLLSNAFRFTDAGGKVTVILTATDTHATVEIRDTGCGMTPEVGSHIFEKFYQGDTSRACQGNGLGLALVKRVVDILQGQICVESTLGEGSAFTVTIGRE